MGSSSPRLHSTRASRYLLPVPAKLAHLSWSVIVLSLVVAALTTSSSARAADESGCVRILERGQDAVAVILAAGCDLRTVARALPQRDEATGKTLPMVEQLRSIYAFNEQLATNDPKSPRTVKRGCVPGTVPPTATPEEREACPEGLVNYYGIASVGNQAVIHVPRSRVSSASERLEALGRTTCGALLGLRANYADEAAVPEPVKQTLAACRDHLGATIEAIELDAPRTKEIAPASAGALTLDPDRDRRIQELEAGMDALVASSAGQRSEAGITIAILGATVLLLLALIGFMWHRAREARDQLAKRTTTNPDEVAQLIERLKKEFNTKLAAATKSHSVQLREQIAAMRAVEREYEEAIEFSRDAMQQHLAKRDTVIRDLEQSARALSVQAQQSRVRAEKAEKQSEKLRARLRSAKTGDIATGERGQEGGAFIPSA